MFGLNLWARPFMPPAPGTMGMDNPGGLPRGHPALGLGTPTYLLPGLTGEKSATAAMHSPFAPGSLFMYRPDSMLHPHMLRVNVDQGLHLGQNESERSGGSLPHSLRDPHSSDSGSVESYPSAFQPTKRARISAEDCVPSRVPSRHSDGGHKSDHEPGQIYGMERSSHGSMEERVGGLIGVGRTAGGSSPRSGRSPDSSYGASPKDGRQPGGSSPRSEPRTPGGPPRCPVCGQGLAPGEVDAHYAMEMDRLRVLARMERGENAAEGADNVGGSRAAASSSSSSTGGSNTSSVSTSGSLSVSESRYETYLKIRNNRHVRLCAKTRARRKRPSDTPPHDGMDCREDGDPMSPPHHPHLPSQAHHAQHAPHPAAHHPHYPHPHPPHVNTSSASSMDNEAHQGIASSSPHSSPTVIEPIMNHVNCFPAHSYHQRSPLYHSAAQRSPTYHSAAATATHAPYQPPPAAAHIPRSPTNCPQGSPPGRAASPPPPAPPASTPASHQSSQEKPESDDEDEFIRVDSPRPESVIVNPASSDSQSSPNPSTSTSSSSERPASPHLAIPASHLARQPVSIKCQVCQGNYIRPVTSVTCWHVHCEDCWLKTLGNKRLCPQCKAITSPSDLRKVYI